MEKKEFIELAIKKFEHLSQPPFDSNIKFWLEKHKINGSFLIAIGDLYDEMQKLNLPQVSKRLIIPRPGDYYETFEEGQRKSDVEGLTWHEKYVRDLESWKQTGRY